MADPVKLLVVDDDAVIRGMFVDYFGDLEGYELCGEAADGLSALGMIEEYQPDVVILDVVLSKLDGIEVLKKLRAGGYGKMPNVIMISSMGIENIIRQTIELGAKYFMIKPVEMSLVEERISEMLNLFPTHTPVANTLAAPAVREKSLDEQISSIFLIVGIPAHIKGFHYLREAIRLVVEEPDMINRITKELYPRIAQHFDTSASKVERAIRHAIEVAWSRGKIENINQVFGYNIYSENDKPTNGDFIALIADKIILELAAS